MQVGEPGQTELDEFQHSSGYAACSCLSRNDGHCMNRNINPLRMLRALQVDLIQRRPNCLFRDLLPIFVKPAIDFNCDVRSTDNVSSRQDVFEVLCG
jgi:hypothetical protein